MRVSRSLPVLVCVGALMIGCGGSGSAGAPSISKADEAVAAKIRASAKKRANQVSEIQTEQEIKRLNEKNNPKTESKAPTIPPASVTKKPATADPSPTSDGTELLSVSDRASFVELEAELGGSSGIAVKAAGVGGATASAGTLRTGDAWSTMKTGVAAATYAAGPPSAATSALLIRAITASDNAAAEQLWSALGPPDHAGAKVSAQLRAAGDTGTTVQTQRVRAGFTAFGQSQWALPAQVKFAAGLACTAPGKQVLALMGQVVSDQRWGLGSAGVPAAFKGGWGPGSDGGYLVRQMGILTVHDRPIAVAIANLPADGAFGTGTSNLTRIAKWFVEHVGYARAPAHIKC